MLIARLNAMRFEDEDGFTLVELLVVVVLLGVIGSFVSVSLTTGMRGSQATQRRYDALTQMQTAVDRMARELRAADPVMFRQPVVGSSPVAYSAVSGSNTAVVEVYRDAPTFGQKIRFTYTYCPATGRIHVRQENAPPAQWQAVDCNNAANLPPVLISGIDNAAAPAVPVFSYLTQTEVARDPALGPTDVFRLRVTLRRAIPNQAPLYVTTSVRVRNAR